MILVPAEINQKGIDALLTYAENPDSLQLEENKLTEEDFDGWGSFIPGISVPSVPGLEEPFNVPVIGDNESISMEIHWPRRGSSGVPMGNVLRRVVFVGQLPAEEVTRGGRDSIDRLFDRLLGDGGYSEEEWLELEAEDAKDEALDEAFDDFADLGGFLHATAEAYVKPEEMFEDRIHTRGSARFYLFESELEFERISSLLDDGETTPTELITLAKFSAYSLNALIANARQH